MFAKSKCHLSKPLQWIILLGLAFSILGADGQYSASLLRAASASTVEKPLLNSPDPCLTQVIQIILAAESISFCAPISQVYQVIKDEISDPNVTIAQLYQVEGYGLLNIRSVTPGFSPGLGRPVYDLGGVEEYRQAVWRLESSRSDRVVSSAPTGAFWDEVVPGMQIDLMLPSSSGDLQVRSMEWVVEHDGRLWSFIVTWDTKMGNAQEWEEFSKHFSMQEADFTSSLDTATDLESASLETRSASTIPVIEALADLGTPTWWSGVCNDDNYFPATGVHSYPLGAVWHGVLSCGPFTFKPPYPYHLVRFFPGAWGEYEFTCVELVMRALYLEWGIAPWSGNANTIKNSPPASIVFYPNGSHTIVTGDIITEDGSSQNSTGHAVIVTGVYLDDTGTGWLTFIEQNSSPSASRSLHVTNGVVDPDPYTWGQTIQGWLHVIGNQDLPITISGNVGVGNVTLTYEDNGLHAVTSASDVTYSLQVTYNWSGTITPNHPFTAFDPSSRTYTSLTTSQVDQDFTATHLDYVLYLPLVLYSP